MTKVLVTGASGLLGSHVVRELIQQKYSVRILVRKGANLKALSGSSVEIIEGEITSKKDIEHALESCSCVIHIAARTAQFPSALEPFQKPNIKSVEHLIQACLRFKLKRFVFVSTANCFGSGSLENPGTEETPFFPWLKKSGYAYSKFLAQQKVLQAVKNGLDAVVVNPTFILGENDFKPSSGQIFGHVLNKKICFYPPGGKNFIDAEMAAFGVVRAQEKGKSGECYLLAGENHSFKTFFKMIVEFTQQKTMLVPLPKYLLLLAGRVGSFIETVFKKPKPLTITNAKLLCSDNYYSPQKAIRELGLKITPTSIAAEKALAWFKKNNYFM